MKKILLIILGIVLVILGLLAALTPATPGSWLVLIGLELLGLRLIVQRKVLSILPKSMRLRVEAGLNRLMENRWFRRLRPKDPSEKKS